MRDVLLSSPRWLLTAAVALSMAVLAAADPWWARAAGVDVWNLSECEQELAAGIAYRHELNTRDDLICQRIAFKEQLVADLIDGRLPLAEATARFSLLNETEPGIGVVVRGNYPGRTYQEKTARNVVEYALVRLNDTSPEHLRARERLLGELRAFIASVEPN